MTTAHTPMNFSEYVNEFVMAGGDGDTVPPLGREWLTFVDTDEFNTWIDQ